MDHERKILGQHIREVMKSQGMSAAELAKQIPCERTNIYNVFNRDSINTRLLQRTVPAQRSRRGAQRGTEVHEALVVGRRWRQLKIER